jgi:hypothetical protein
MRETEPATTTNDPSDNTTLVEVLAGYRSGGYAATFWAEDNTNVRCGACSSILDARRFSMQSMRRLEGASDPADMVVVVATACPVCAARGTMVLGYGPTASAADAAVLTAMHDVRTTDDDLPANASPDEMPKEPDQGTPR